MRLQEKNVKTIVHTDALYKARFKVLKNHIKRELYEIQKQHSSVNIRKLENHTRVKSEKYIYIHVRSDNVNKIK